MCLQHRGHVLTWPGVFSRLLSSLAAALYAAAVLVFDSQLGFLLKVLPWSLSAACCCALDLVVSLHVPPRLPQHSCVAGGGGGRGGEGATTVLVQYEFRNLALNSFFDLLTFDSTRSDSLPPLAEEAGQSVAERFPPRQRRKLRF